MASSSSSSSSSSLSSSPPPPPSSSRKVKHQVFLSFRGTDRRPGFTNYLLKALKAKSINVCFDEETLEKGEQISPSLSVGIEKTEIAIIILSEDYASSKSCLAELSEIMDKKRSAGQVVVPIFYHVKPFDVQNHRGSFGKSFDEYEHSSKRPADHVQCWKNAFVEVGELTGCHIVGGNNDRY